MRTSVTFTSTVEVQLFPSCDWTKKAFRAPVFENGRVDKNGFNLGLRNNFKQIFGNQYVLWPFPVFTSFGDGVVFPQRYDAVISASMNSAETTTAHHAMMYP
ncbi:hypothetical protein ACFE04_016277 [Oxalis oulophora]